MLGVGEWNPAAESRGFNFPKALFIEFLPEASDGLLDIVSISQMGRLRLPG